MEDVEKEQLQAWLAKVRKDLVELKTVENYLLKQLGETAEVPVELPVVSGTGIHARILPKFQKGHFYGSSKAKAGFEVLQRAGQPLTVNEILQVLIESGYLNGSDDDRSLLSIALSRSRRLVRVAPNTFDLAHRRQKPRRTKEPKKEELQKETAQLEEQTQAAPETGEGIESN